MRKSLVVSLSNPTNKVQENIVCTDNNIKEVVKQDISNWKMRGFCFIEHMFERCRIKPEYKPKNI